MKIDFANKATQWFTMAFLSLIWGSSFILMKRGLVSFSAEEVAAYRIFIVFVSLVPFSFKFLKNLKGKQAFILFLTGIFGSAFPYFFFVKAQTQIDSSLSGILNSLTPLFTLLFAYFFFKQRFRTFSIIGVLLGLIGASGLIYFSGNESLSGISYYAILPIVASASYGLNVNLIKMYLQHLSSIEITGLSFMTIGPFTGLYLFLGTDFIPHLTSSEQGWTSLGYITILGVVGTAVAVWIFNMLIKETSALFASSVTYLIPIVAIAWGVLDHENINIYQFIFTGVIFLGISLINSKRSFKKKSL